MVSKAEYLNVSAENLDVTTSRKTESHIGPMQLIGGK